ncbi:MAG: hypothetical protein K2M42_12065 [Oscillospiraceae bacterium]|nr:hypothetical protein [Oscillospiraceae bacterium]
MLRSAEALPNLFRAIAKRTTDRSLSSSKKKDILFLKKVGERSAQPFRAGQIFSDCGQSCGQGKSTERGSHKKFREQENPLEILRFQADFCFALMRKMRPAIGLQKKDRHSPCGERRVLTVCRLPWWTIQDLNL